MSREGLADAVLRLMRRRGITVRVEEKRGFKALLVRPGGMLTDYMKQALMLCREEIIEQIERESHEHPSATS